MSHPTFSNQLRIQHVTSNLSDPVSRALEANYQLLHFTRLYYLQRNRTAKLSGGFEIIWTSVFNAYDKCTSQSQHDSTIYALIKTETF